MKRLVIAVAVAAGLYAAYWVVGSRMVEGQAREALTNLQSQGWKVEYTDLATRGFPSRFDTTIEDVALTAPNGLEYSAPFLQAFALAYRPTEVIAAFPPEQTFSVTGQDVVLTSDRLRASGAVKAGTDLALENATVEGSGIAVTFAPGVAVAMDRLLLALRGAEGDGPLYDIFAEAAGIALPAFAAPQRAPIDRVALSATAELTAPLDRYAGGIAPAVLRLAVDEVVLRWDQGQIIGSGVLTPDIAGYAEGEMAFEIRRWGDMLDALTEQGLLDADLAATYRNMADTLAQGEEVLDLTVTFAGGSASLGFVTLGPAPRLR